jgi:hypothetical protein
MSMHYLFMLLVLHLFRSFDTVDADAGFVGTTLAAELKKNFDEADVFNVSSLTDYLVRDDIYASQIFSLSQKLELLQHNTSTSFATKSMKLIKSLSRYVHSEDVTEGTCSDSLRMAAYSPYDFCSGVVDYDFYVPVNATLASLGSQASFLGYNVPALFPSRCLTDFKRLICANVYRPCSRYS